MYKSFCIIFILFSSAYAVPCPFLFSRSRSVDNERNLIKKGFPETYISNFDTATQLIKSRQLWIKKNAQPEEKHISYFAQQIDAHIEEFRKGINNLDLPDAEKHKRLRTLKALKNEAYFIRRTYKVTSTWWNLFNIRLIALVTPSVESTFNLGLSLEQLLDYEIVYKRLKETSKTVNLLGIHSYFEVLEKFPDIVLVPIVGDVGPMAFNQVAGEGIYFLRVSSVSVEMGLKNLDPQIYFGYEVQRITSVEKYLSHLRKKSPFFYSQFKLRIKTLPTEQRQQQELAYYLLMFERGSMSGSDESIFQRNFYRMLRSTDFSNLLPSVMGGMQIADSASEDMLREYFDGMITNYNALSQTLSMVNTR